MYYCIEKDWKLYRKMIPSWQEKYIDKVNREIIKILLSDGNPSERFWNTYDFILKAKENPGVLISDASRSKFDSLMISLAQNKVISKADISEFSEEMKELLEPYF